MHRSKLLPSLPRLAAVAVLALVGGCKTTSGPIKVYQDEGFESGETYSRLFDAPVEQTCEAARRALLSQGYVVSVLKADAVNGTKSFQPEGDIHVQIEFHVVCASDGGSGKIATAYVSALQDRYTLKKSPNSASVGVSAIGSVSIPFMSSDDSMVKVASETIPAGPFYDRFFTLMHRYLREQAASE